MMNQNKEFQAILVEHKGIFYKVAKTYCQDEDDRKDLLQEMMIQVWRALPKYDSAFKLSTWLYRIVLNVAISNYRKSNTLRQKIEVVDFEKLDIADISEAETNPNVLLLEKFINELNDLDKALIILYLEDKSQTEIAEILGISSSNVSTKIFRIKEKIKEKFKKHN